MLFAYIVALLIGGVLVLLSFFGGEHGADHDHDFSGGHDLDHGSDLDVGHDHGFDWGWIPFFSLRFWTYFALVFGLCGYLFTKVLELQEPTAGFIAGGAGFLGGTAVALMMKLFRKLQADSSIQTGDLLGVIGTVLVPARDNQPGKIRCTVKGDIIEMLALPENVGDSLEAGSSVVIVSVENDRAKVISQQEIYGA